MTLQIIMLCWGPVIVKVGSLSYTAQDTSLVVIRAQLEMGLITKDNMSPFSTVSHWLGMVPFDGIQRGKLLYNQREHKFLSLSHAKDHFRHMCAGHTVDS